MISFLALAQLSARGAGTEPEKGRQLQGGAALAADSMPPKRNAEMEAAFSNAAPFAQEAARKGITVSEDDVAQRLKMYNNLYPGQPIDASRTKRMLLAEKYLESKDVGAGAEELDRAIAGKVDPSKFSSPEDAEMAKRAARFEILLAREETKAEGRNLEDLAQIQRASDLAPTPLWPLEEIQVQGDAGECLAWMRGDCFVSVQEYNAAAAQYRLQASLPLDSARAAVLKWYLLQKNLAEKDREPGLYQNPDSILYAQKQKRQATRWIQMARRFGVPVQDIHILKSLYGMHYREYFAPWQEATLSLIGSSDSAYLDSLHQVLAAWDLRSGGKRVLDGKTIKEPSLPWISFKENELPGELVAVTDSFHVGQFSAPFRARFGFFMVRLSKLVSHKEISFDDAVPHLVFLATRNKFLEMDSVLEAQARRYYKDHKADYALPDTVKLLGWLLPQHTPWEGRPPLAGRGRAFLADTAYVKSFALSSLTLPREIQLQLQVLARANPRQAFFGPLSNRYGKWYFRIRSRKPAHDTIPYRLARKDIVNKITAPPPDMENGFATDESLDEVLLTLGRAIAAKRQGRAESGTYGATPDIPADASEAERLKAYAQARDHMLEMRADQKRKEDDFLKEVQIDSSRLFNPGTALVGK